MNAIILGVIPVGFLAVLFGPGGEARIGSLIAAALQLVASVISYRIARSGRVRLAAYLFFGAFSLLIAVYSMLNDGELTSLSTPYWLCFVVGGAAMVISGPATLHFAILNLVLLLGIAGFFLRTAPDPTFSMVMRAITWPAMMLILLAVFVWQLANSVERTLEWARRNRAALREQLEHNQRLMEHVQGRLAPTAEELAATMVQLRSTAEGIATSINEMAQGAETQARQSEMVSHSMAQLAGATRRITDSHRNAGDASSLTRDLVQSTAQALHALETRLAEIEQLVVLVDKTADQTNLLALNASIEAARAGEHGAGFAVVADEVRRLADHSATSVGKVTTLSQEVGAGLRELVASMEEAQQGSDHAASLAQEIIAALEEQRRATETMVSGVNETATVAEENAAASEEIAAAVEEQVASIDQVASSAQVLAELAANLQQTLEGQRQG